MQIDDRRREVKSLDLLPLINVVFLLILFVLIAGRPTTNHPQQIDVATSVQPTAYEAAPFAVLLDKDNRFLLPDGRERTLGELADLVRDRGLPEQQRPVELIADRAAEARALLDFRAAMAKAGIGEIRLKTQLQGPAE